MSTAPRLDKGSNDERNRRVAEHYDELSDREDALENESYWDSSDGAMVFIPRELLPAIRALIERYEALKANIEGLDPPP